MRRSLLSAKYDTEALTCQGWRGRLVNSSNEVSAVDCDDDSKMRRLNVLLDSELHKALRVRTVIEGKSMSAVIKDALTLYFNSVSESEILTDRFRKAYERSKYVKRSEDV